MSKKKKKNQKRKLMKAGPEGNKLRQKLMKLPPLPENKDGTIRGMAYSPYRRWRSHY